MKVISKKTWVYISLFLIVIFCLFSAFQNMKINQPLIITVNDICEIGGDKESEFVIDSSDVLSFVVRKLNENDILTDNSNSNFIFEGAREINNSVFYIVSEYSNNSDTISKINSYAVTKDLNNIYFIYDPTLNIIDKNHFMYNHVKNLDKNDGHTRLIKIE
jgi:hypothetical protein